MLRNAAERRANMNDCMHVTFGYRRHCSAPVDDKPAIVWLSFPSPVNSFIPYYLYCYCPPF